GLRPARRPRRSTARWGDELNSLAPTVPRFGRTIMMRWHHVASSEPGDRTADPSDPRSDRADPTLRRWRVTGLPRQGARGSEEPPGRDDPIGVARFKSAGGGTEKVPGRDARP